MRKIIIALIGILIVSCSKESETNYSTKSEKVFLIITEKTTETELTAIASEFKADKNITVDFSKTEFTDDGTIKNLDLKVDCKDGFNGSTTNSGIILRGQSFGFSRDYSEKAKVPFAIGAM